MIRDIIVVGTNSRKIREKLINEGKDLILDKAIYIARAHELSQSQNEVNGGKRGSHSHCQKRSHHTSQRLFGYGGKPLKVFGKCTLACS